MSIVNINQALSVMGENAAIAGLVCLGWEEAQAFVAAAEAENTPAILMVGPGARAAMPLPVWAPMLRHLAENVAVPFVIHLDHGRDLDEVKQALDLGFSSVMYDGSLLSFDDNVANTRAMAEMAVRYGASSEGEIGVVGYADGAQSAGTNVDDAMRFAAETAIDLMAVSIGNTHLQKHATATLDYDAAARLGTIGTPLVVHGGSGIHPDDRNRLRRDHNFRKFNIGTEIRQIYGATMRETFAQDAEIFDHLAIAKTVHQPMVDAARKVINALAE